MIIPSITPLPPSPQRTDPATFAARADASLTAQETVFTPELNAFASAVNVTQGEMTVLSNTAITQAQIATTQAVAAASSALSAGATVWVSGTTYTVGVSRYSPLDGQVYRRMVGGAGTTDPSLDAVNWRVVNGLTSELIVLPFNNLPSMRPSLNLDFANNQSVDPRITFTRASTATYTNPLGRIDTAASGSPRLDWDPVTLACRGFLIEEQRTNLLTYSGAFDNAAWSKVRSTTTANATTAPDGTLTADKLVEDTTAASTHNIFFARTASNETVTFSIYAKASERTRFRLSLSNFASHNIFATFDLVAGTNPVAPVANADYSSVSSLILPVGNGWYRCCLTATKGSVNTQNNCYLETENNSSVSTYTGDGTSGLFIWGAQLEAGAFLTSYIPTVASQVTRAADVASMTGANFSSWYRQDEFSVALQIIGRASGTVVYASWNDATTNEVIKLESISGALTLSIIDGGVTQAALSLGTIVTGTVYKIAAAWKLNDIAASINGAAVTTDIAATLPTVTQLGIASSLAFVTGYPKRLTNAELQALSTQ